MTAIQRRVLDAEKFRADSRPITPLEVFGAGSDFGFRSFWRSPTESEATDRHTDGADRQTMVGIGIAKEWAAADTDFTSRFADAENFLAQLEVSGDTPILMGGFAFGETPPADSSAQNATTTWAGFSSGRLVLPQVLFVFSDEDSDPDADKTATEVILSGTEAKAVLEEVLTEIAKRRNVTNNVVPKEPVAETVNPETNSAAPSLAPQNLATISNSYAQKVEVALNAIEGGELEKVVLAQQLTQPFCPAPEVALANLCETSHQSCVFAFSSSELSGTDPASSSTNTAIFLGASPELLAQKSQNSFASLALAGTKPIAEANTLLRDQKELSEHQHVVEHLRTRLLEIQADVAPIAHPEILRLPKIAHLATKVSGITTQSILKLLETLHPSPAVAGTPTEAATEFITKHEGFHRGWYAGPVGWLTPNGEGTFYVALRSALLNPSQNQSHLFAGSGIVKGSSPQTETKETTLKLQTALTALQP